MDELSTIDTKAQLIAELARARGSMSRSWSAFKRDANVAAHVRNSIRTNKSAWLGGAAVLGWILSLLPPRRRNVKVLVDRSDRPVRKVYKAGMLFSLFRMLLPLIKPTVMAFVTQKLTEFTMKKEAEKTGVRRIPNT